MKDDLHKNVSNNVRATKEVIVTIATKAGAVHDLCPIGKDEKDVVDYFIEEKDFDELKAFMQDSDKTVRSYAYSEYEPVKVTAKEGGNVVCEEEYGEAMELGYFDLCSDEDVTDTNGLDKDVKAIRRKVADSGDEFSKHYISLFCKAGLKVGDAHMVIGHRTGTPLLMTYKIQIPADEEFDIKKLCIMWLCECTFDWHPRYDADDTGERCADVILYDGKLYEGTFSMEGDVTKETTWVTNDLSSYKSLLQNREDGGNNDDEDWVPFCDDDVNEENVSEEKEVEEAEQKKEVKKTEVKKKKGRKDNEEDNKENGEKEQNEKV